MKHATKQFPFTTRNYYTIIMRLATTMSSVLCGRLEIAFTCCRYMRASSGTDAAAQGRHRLCAGPRHPRGSRPLGRRRPRRLSAGASSLSTVLCWCVWIRLVLRFELDGDDYGDLPDGRDRPIRAQAIDRDNGGQDISHLVDGDGRCAVREERNCL